MGATSCARGGRLYTAWGLRVESAGMRGLISRVLLVSWAVWLGGLVGTLVAVTTIFAALDPDRTAAGNIAARVFARSEVVMLVAGGLAVLSAGALWVRRRSTVRTAAAVILLLAGVASCVSHFGISARLQTMRDQGLTKTDDFKRLHGASMGMYVTIAALLTAGGLLLPGVIRRPEEDER